MASSNSTNDNSTDGSNSTDDNPNDNSNSTMASSNSTNDNPTDGSNSTDDNPNDNSNSTMASSNSTNDNPTDGSNSTDDNPNDNSNSTMASSNSTNDNPTDGSNSTDDNPTDDIPRICNNPATERFVQDTTQREQLVFFVGLYQTLGLPNGVPAHLIYKQLGKKKVDVERSSGLPITTFTSHGNKPDHRAVVRILPKPCNDYWNSTVSLTLAGEQYLSYHKSRLFNMYCRRCDNKEKNKAIDLDPTLIDLIHIPETTEGMKRRVCCWFSDTSIGNKTLKYLFENPGYQSIEDLCAKANEKPKWFQDKRMRDKVLCSVYGIREAIGQCEKKRVRLPCQCFPTENFVPTDGYEESKKIYEDENKRFREHCLKEEIILERKWQIKTTNNNMPVRSLISVEEFSENMKQYCGIEIGNYARIKYPYPIDHTTKMKRLILDIALIAVSISTTDYPNYPNHALDYYDKMNFPPRQLLTLAGFDWKILQENDLDIYEITKGKQSISHKVSMIFLKNGDRYFRNNEYHERQYVSLWVMGKGKDKDGGGILVPSQYGMATLFRNTNENFPDKIKEHFFGWEQSKTWQNKGTFEISEVHGLAPTKILCEPLLSAEKFTNYLMKYCKMPQSHKHAFKSYPFPNDRSICTSLSFVNATFTGYNGGGSQDFVTDGFTCNNENNYQQAIEFAKKQYKIDYVEVAEEEPLLTVLADIREPKILMLRFTPPEDSDETEYSGHCYEEVCEDKRTTNVLWCTWFPNHKSTGGIIFPCFNGYAYEINYNASVKGEYEYSEGDLYELLCEILLPQKKSGASIGRSVSLVKAFHMTNQTGGKMKRGNEEKYEHMVFNDNNDEEERKLPAKVSAKKSGKKSASTTNKGKDKEGTAGNEEKYESMVFNNDNNDEEERKLPAKVSAKKSGKKSASTTNKGKDKEGTAKRLAKKSGKKRQGQGAVSSKKMKKK